MTPPVLAYPDFTNRFILHSDASGLGLDAIEQEQEDGQLHPVAYASRTSMV